MNQVAEMIKIRYDFELEAAGKTDRHFVFAKPHCYVLATLRDLAHMIATKNPDQAEALYAAVRMKP